MRTRCVCLWGGGGGEHPGNVPPLSVWLVMDGDSFSVVDTQYQEMNLKQAASNPQLCSDFLSRGSDLCGLQQVLQDADHTWMEKFLQNGGLPNLLSTLDRKGDSSNNIQECVVCVKLVLNHKLGIKSVFEQPREDHFIRKLVRGMWSTAIGRHGIHLQVWYCVMMRTLCHFMHLVCKLLSWGCWKSRQYLKACGQGTRNRNTCSCFAQMINRADYAARRPLDHFNILFLGWPTLLSRNFLLGLKSEVKFN